MGEVNRRNLLKAIVASPAVLLGGTEPETKPTKPLAKEIIQGEGPFIKFCGRWFTSELQTIRWTDLDALPGIILPDSIETCFPNWCRFDTFDRFDFWVPGQGVLYWIGLDEVREIRPLGGVIEFEIRLLGYRSQLAGRLAYRYVDLSQPY